MARTKLLKLGEFSSKSLCRNLEKALPIASFAQYLKLYKYVGIPSEPHGVCIPIWESKACFESYAVKITYLISLADIEFARHSKTAAGFLCSVIWLKIKTRRIGEAILEAVSTNRKLSTGNHYLFILEASMNHSAALITLISLCAPSRNHWKFFSTTSWNLPGQEN